jgi:hypothetical protein
MADENKASSRSYIPASFGSNLPAIGSGVLSFAMFVTIMTLFNKYKKKVNNSTMLTFFAFLAVSFVLCTTNVALADNNGPVIAMNILLSLTIFTVMIMLLVL